MQVSAEWYGWLAAELRRRALAPTVFNLEGGYGPKQCALAVERIIDGLTGTPPANFLRTLGLLRDVDAATSSESESTAPPKERPKRSSPRSVDDPPLEWEQGEGTPSLWLQPPTAVARLRLDNARAKQQSAVQSALRRRRRPSSEGHGQLVAL